MKVFSNLHELLSAIDDQRVIWHTQLCDTVKVIDCGREKLSVLSSLVDNGRLFIKPALKKIDLSGLVGSGVLVELSDCLFGADDGVGDCYISLLKEIKTSGDFRFVETDDGQNKHCRPLFNHPHVHAGGMCPVPAGFTIRITHRDGTHTDCDQVEIDGDHWSHGKGVADFDIIAWEATGIAEGYEL